jgi:ferredoxin
VEIDHTICQGFGACVEMCSKFILSDETGKSHMEDAKKVSTGETKDVDNLDCYLKAAKACPFTAIHVTDLQTNEKLI